METQKTRNKPKLTSVIGGVEKGVILALLPFVGYVTAYNYEKGYLSYFGIPSFLIRIGLEEVITAATVVLTGLFGLYYLMAILYLFKDLLTKSAKGFTLFKSIVLFLFLYPFIFTFNSGILLDKLITSLAILFAILFWQFGFPIIFQRGNTLEEKIIKADKVDNEVCTIEDLILSRPKLKITYLTFIVILVFSGLASSAGSRDAAKQKDYLLFSNNGTYVVIRAYANKYIAVEINDKSKHIESRVKIIPADNDFELHLENIGPLNKEEGKSILASLFNFMENIFNKTVLFLRNILTTIKQAIFRN